jgi:phage recombination protein Bet
MSTALATTNKASPLYALASRFNIEPTKLLEVLRGTVIKPDRNGKAATNEEIAAFCIVADQYGLSPFTREIHAFTSGDKGVVPIVGIDGWTKIVNTRGDFDGLEFDDVSDEQGGPVAVTCRMFVKGRTHPVAVTERFSECKRNSIPWQTMPWRMLRHKAYMQAARYAFGLAGIYDEDEARDIVKNAKRGEPVEVDAVVTDTLKRKPMAFPAPVEAVEAKTEPEAIPEPIEPEKPAKAVKGAKSKAEQVAAVQSEFGPGAGDDDEVPM